MKLSFLTLFPPIIQAYLSESIMAKAVEGGIFSYEIVNIRDFARNKHRKCDDYPYGGGAGMVFKPEPLAGAIESVREQGARIIYPSPSGKPFHQGIARSLAREEHLIFICGRYEGIDQRIIDAYVDDELSIGDYVLSSGEIASLVITDSVYRLIDGVITPESLEEESFSDGLLEYPHYTRPEIFNSIGVPEILLSGHHERIRMWRLRQQLKKTRQYRPDLLEKPGFSDEIQGLIRDLKREEREREEGEE